MFLTGILFVFVVAATAATEGMRSIREVSSLPDVLSPATAATEGMRSIREVSSLPDVLSPATAATSGMQSIREVSPLPSLPALKNKTAPASFYQKLFCFHTEMLFQRKHRLLSGVRTLCRILGFLIAPVARSNARTGRPSEPAIRQDVASGRLRPLLLHFLGEIRKTYIRNTREHLTEADVFYYTHFPV